MYLEREKQRFLEYQILHHWSVEARKYYKIIKFFSEVSLYSSKRKCCRAVAKVENIGGKFLPLKICQNCEGWEPHQTWFQWWEAQCTTGQTIFIWQDGCRFFQGDALVCYQGADWTSFIFCHYCQLWFSHFTHQIMTYSITLGLLTKIFFQSSQY